MKKHDVEFNILCTVNAANQDHPLEVYRYFRDELGARFIQFIPIVERDNETGFQEGDQVTDRSRRPRCLGPVPDRRLRRVAPPRRGHGVRVAISTPLLASWVGVPPALCVFARDLRECCRA